MSEAQYVCRKCGETFSTDEATIPLERMDCLVEDAVNGWRHDWELVQPYEEDTDNQG